MSASPLDPATLQAMFVALGVRLPLRLADEDVGVVLDADGRDVLTIDVNGERPDGQATEIAALVAFVVNVAAGFGRPPVAKPLPSGGGVMPVRSPSSTFWEVTRHDQA